MLWMVLYGGYGEAKPPDANSTCVEVQNESDVVDGMHVCAIASLKNFGYLRFLQDLRDVRIDGITLSGRSTDIYFHGKLERCFFGPIETHGDHNSVSG